jgi:hypothetical protein
MARHKLMVMTNPTEMREDEYNDWYTNKHLADVVAVPGFVSAQRFKLIDPMGFEHKHRYLAIYEIESDQPKEVLVKMFSLQDTPAMFISEALDMKTASCGLFEECSPVVFAKARTPAQDTKVA